MPCRCVYPRARCTSRLVYSPEVSRYVFVPSVYQTIVNLQLFFSMSHELSQQLQCQGRNKGVLWWYTILSTSCRAPIHSARARDELDGSHADSVSTRRYPPFVSNYSIQCLGNKLRACL
jgi:hypothetical protein